MKTAISLADLTYDRVTRRAHELGVSRSELFARAAEAYLDQLDSDSVTEQIDAVLVRLEDGDESSVAATAAGRARLRDGDGDW